jgi:hypothetical protein
MEGGSKLPVLGVLGEALHDVLANLDGLARVAWPYYLLAAGLGLLGRLPFGGPAGWLTSFVVSGTAGIVVSLGVLACVVRWQRHLLLGQELRGIAPLDRHVARYGLWSVALALICAVPALLALALGLATGLVDRQEGSAAPLAIGLPGLALLLAGAGLALFLFVRLGLVLPAASIGDRRMGPRGSWAATRSQGLRLVAILVLLALGMGLVGAAAGLLDAAFSLVLGSEPGGNLGAATTTLVLETVVDLVTAVVGASVTAAIYRRLVRTSPDAGASI